MPATKVSNSLITYMQITNGNLVVKSKEGNPEATYRKNKDGKDTWEILYRNVTGRVTKIEINEHKSADGKVFETWEVTLDDGENTFLVSTTAGSGYARDMLPKLASADLTKPVTLQPYGFEKNYGVTVFQDGVKLMNKWVKKIGEKEYQYLDGFPELKKGMRGSKFQMYKLQVHEFIKDYYENNVIPLLNDTPAVDQEEDDDLPF